MRRTVARLASGIIDQNPPVLRVQQPHIEETVSCGQEYRAEIRLESENQLSFRGLIYVDDDRIELPVNQFAGTSAVLPFILHGETIRENTELEGVFSLVTNAGELEIPYCFRLRQSLLLQEKMPESARELADLAERRPELISAFFRSGSFDSQPWLRKDPSLRALSSGLKKSEDIRRGMAELLAAGGCGELPRLSADTSLHYYVLGPGEDRADIMLTLHGSGYVSVELEAEGSFLRLPRQRLIARDFREGVASVSVCFERNRMVPGVNRGALLIKNGRQWLRLPIEVREKKEKTEEPAQRHLLRERVRLEKLLIKTYAGTPSEELGEDLLKAWKRLADAAETPTLGLQVLQAELLRRLGRTEEERALLGELRTDVQRGRSREPAAYLWYLYLEALLGSRRDSIAGMARLVRRYAEEGLEAPELLLLQLQLEDLCDETPEELWLRLKRMLANGSDLETELLLAACRFLENHPEYLTPDDLLDEKILLFGVRHGLWQGEMLDCAAAWACSRKKRTTGSHRLLTALYACRPDKRLLERICAGLIGEGRLQADCNRWYREGIREDIRLTKLYDYYLCTLPEDGGELPRELLLYFGYNPPEPAAAKRTLYRHLLREYEPESSLYRLYEKQMRNYALDKLLEGAVSEELAQLYDRVFVPEVLDKRSAPLLLQLLHTEHVTGLREGVRRIIAVYPELDGEIPFAVENGEAYPMVTEDCRLLQEDVSGSRFAGPEPERKPLFPPREALEAACRRLCPDEMWCRLTDAKLFSERVPQDEDEMARLEAVLNWQNLSPLCREDILLRLGRELPDTEAANVLLSRLAEAPYLQEKTGKALLEAFLQRENMPAAKILLERFGYRGIRCELLLRLIGRRIRDLHYEYEEICFRAALFLYREGYRNAVTLSYLCRHFNGSSREMRDVLKLSLGSSGVPYDMGERLLGQMLFSGVTDDLEWVAELYQTHAEKTDVLLLSAYAAVECDRYFRGIIPMSDRLAAMLQARILPQKEAGGLPRVCQLALVRCYADRGSLNEQEAALAELLVRKLAREGLAFGFEKKLADRISLPSELLDKTFLEYQGEPGQTVQLELKIMPGQAEDEPVTVEMPHVYRGFYVKAVMLFAGEWAEYKIYHVSGAARELLAEGKALPDILECGEETRFRKLNRLLKEADGWEDPAWQQAVTEYGKEDVILKNYFTLL